MSAFIHQQTIWRSENRNRRTTQTKYTIFSARVRTKRRNHTPTKRIYSFTSVTHTNRRRRWRWLLVVWDKHWQLKWRRVVEKRKLVDAKSTCAIDKRAERHISRYCCLTFWNESAVSPAFDRNAIAFVYFDNFFLFNFCLLSRSSTLAPFAQTRHRVAFERICVFVCSEDVHTTPNIGAIVEQSTNWKYLFIISFRSFVAVDVVVVAVVVRPANVDVNSIFSSTFFRFIFGIYSSAIRCH